MADDNSGPVTLLLIDTHTMFREAIAACLALESDLALIGEASSWVEGLRKPALRRASVLLFGAHGPHERAADFMSCLTAGGFAGRVVVLDGGLAAGEADQLLHAGAAAVIC